MPLAQFTPHSRRENEVINKLLEYSKKLVQAGPGQVRGVQGVGIFIVHTYIQQTLVSLLQCMPLFCGMAENYEFLVCGQGLDGFG